jgi:inorganic triphosphatase YgiF
MIQLIRGIETVALDDYEQPFRTAIELAHWLLNEENYGEHFQQARRGARLHAKGHTIPLKCIRAVTEIAEFAHTMKPVNFLNALAAADSVIRVMGTIIYGDEGEAV